EVERARYAVLEHLKTDRIDGRLLTTRRGAIEITDRHRPARHVRKRRKCGRRIGRLFLVRCNGAPNDSQRVEHFRAVLGSVMYRKLEDGLAGVRRLDDSPHMLGWEHGLGAELE